MIGKMKLRQWIAPGRVAIMGISLLFARQSTSWAQGTGDSQDKSWTAVTTAGDTGAANPVRSRVTHSESGNRTTETQSLQRLNSDGNYEPYLDVEKETVKVNATTTRTVERSYATDPQGQRKLMQVTEEESRTISAGGAAGVGREVKTVRDTSNPDANGGLQLVHKEIEDSKQLSPDLKETKVSILTPDINGGLSESIRTEARETRTGEHTTQFQKTTSMPDGEGHWQPQEVKKGVITQNGKQQTKEETVLRPDSEGKLEVIQRTVSKEAAGADGETRATTDTYSIDLPGAARDGDLHPVERVTTSHRAGQSGQSTQTQVEQPNPGSPTAGMRVTGETIDIVRPGSDGTTRESRTIESLGGDGSLGVVWVDMGSSNKPAAQGAVAPPAQPPAQQPAPPK
jgi:hypothetical protein